MLADVVQCFLGKEVIAVESLLDSFSNFGAADVEFFGGTDRLCQLEKLIASLPFVQGPFRLIRQKQIEIHFAPFFESFQDNPHSCQLWHSRHPNNRLAKRSGSSRQWPACSAWMKTARS